MDLLHAMIRLTNSTGFSSLVELKTSNPPTLHSPEGDKKTESMEIFPCVDAHVVFMNARAIATRCSPQIVHSSLSLFFSFPLRLPLPPWGLSPHENSTPLRGRTRSVMIHILSPCSTTSIYLRTSGCRVVRSFRNAFFAKGRYCRLDPSK